MQLQRQALQRSFQVTLLAFASTPATAQATLEVALKDLERVGAVSADGSVVVGSRSLAPSFPLLSTGVVVDASGNSTFVAHPPGYDITRLNDVTDDGTTFVGLGSNSMVAGDVRAVRWDGATSPVVLETLSPSTLSVALAISGDGAFVVGSHDQVAARWDTSGAVEILGGLPGLPNSYPLATNADGRVVAGVATGVNFQSVAFRWTAASGMVALAPPAGYPYCTVVSMSDDGQTIVGHAGSSLAANYVLCLWSGSSTQPTVVTDVPESWTPPAGAISGDGQTIVGAWTTSSGDSESFVWSREGGYEDLDSYLRRYGLPGGLQLPTTTIPRCISKDGRTIVGDEEIFAAPGPIWRTTNGSRDEIHRTVCAPPTPTASGLPATLSIAGSPYAAANDVTLRAEGLPAGVLTMFFTSPSVGPPVIPPGSIGPTCIRGAAGRYNGRNALRVSDASGNSELRIDLDITPTPGGSTGVFAGETRYFQCVFRDRSLGAATVNFSSTAQLSFR